MMHLAFGNCGLLKIVQIKAYSDDKLYSLRSRDGHLGCASWSCFFSLMKSWKRVWRITWYRAWHRNFSLWLYFLDFTLVFVHFVFSFFHWGVVGQSLGYDWTAKDFSVCPFWDGLNFHNTTIALDEFISCFFLNDLLWFGFWGLRDPLITYHQNRKTLLCVIHIILVVTIAHLMQICYVVSRS